MSIHGEIDKLPVGVADLGHHRSSQFDRNETSTCGARYETKKRIPTCHAKWVGWLGIVELCIKLFKLTHSRFTALRADRMLIKSIENVLNSQYDASVE